MFQLPEDLGALSLAELTALRAKLRLDALAILRAGKVSAASVRSELADVVEQVEDAISAAELEAELEAEVEADDASKKKDEEPAEEEAPGPDETVQNPPATEPTPEDDEAADEAAPVANVRPRAVPAARGATGTVPAAAVAETQRAGVDIFEATDRAPKKRPGERFDSWTDLSQNLLDFAATLSATSDQRFPIATARANFHPDMTLSEKPIDNLKLFDDPWKKVDEITAAICGPLPSTYNMACQNSTSRPVKASLPNYPAPRGGVQIMQSPSLSDITNGYGIWTRTDDANANATKNACATVKCTSTNSYYIYGVYRCLTVKNLTVMTFPELVEAYLNRLAALQARLAETTLLEAMGAETTTITAHELGYNATTSITSNLLNYMALYREQQRWDDQEMEAWMPRWVVPALQADMIRRKRTDGGVNRVPSEAEVASVFTSAGVTPHFFRDTPSWATPIPNLQTSGNLGWFPRNVEMLVAPRGKFALMDRGDLNIGVAGNIMRDNTSLSKNEFTFFFENFEGVVNTTSCPAHILQLDNLCFNGAQIADLVINCEGGDQRGAAS